MGFFLVTQNSVILPLSAFAGGAVKCWGPFLHHLPGHAQEIPRLQDGWALQWTIQTPHGCRGTILHRPRRPTIWGHPGVPEVRPAAHRGHPGGRFSTWERLSQPYTNGHVSGVVQVHAEAVYYNIRPLIKHLEETPQLFGELVGRQQFLSRLPHYRENIEVR